MRESKLINKKHFNRMFLLSILLWSFFIFALMMFIFANSNNPFIRFLIYSICSYLFWVYYYFNSGKLLSFLKYILSYLIICLFVFIFHKAYNELVLLKKDILTYDDYILIIFAVSLIPNMILFLIGKLILKIIKPRCV